MDVAGRRPATWRFEGLATPGGFAYTPARQRAGRPRRRLVSGEESPGSTERRCRVTPGGPPELRAKVDQGQCHRKDTAGLWPGKVERVRQERTAGLATGPARQTPPGARPNRGGA